MPWAQLSLNSYVSSFQQHLMRINLELQTSDFVDVDLACDHCHGSSKSQKKTIYGAVLCRTAHFKNILRSTALNLIDRGQSSAHKVV